MKQDTGVQRIPQSRWQERWSAIRSGPRVVLLGLLILGIFAAFGWRLWGLQFAQGEVYRARAERQSLRAVSIPAARGIAYDRAGEALVRNVPGFDVVVVPAYLPEDQDELEDVLLRLAMLLNVPYTTAGIEGESGGNRPGLLELVEEVGFLAPYHPLVVKRGVDRDKALVVAQQTILLPGVAVQVQSARDYPYGPLVSQMLGYTLPIPEGSAEDYIEQGYDPATDRVGFAGIEATFEDVLRGEKGQQIVEEDVLGRVVRVVEEQAAPIPGHNVYLTLDLDLQEFVDEALRQGMAEPSVNSPRGVAIAMNPQTGEVLAMVSLPTYDNNLLAQGISTRQWDLLGNDPHRPLLNHAISDGLPPGSVFKVVVAAGALQEGVLMPYTRLSCPGTVVVPNKYYPNDPGRAQPFYCWNLGGHGSLDVVGGIANSCDIFFYQVGGGFEETGFEGLGVNQIANYARMFGFGEPTGIELPAEVSGLVPSTSWKRLTIGESWSTGDSYNLSIGQGYLSVTPLQMLNAVNVVANGGTLYRPTIAHHVTDAEGTVTQPFAPDVLRTLPVEPENWDLIQEGMEGAVVYGTAPRARIEGVRVAGKTGTAQFCDDIALETGICGVGLEQPTHAWFAAYAPVGAPEISVIVFLYNGGEGSTTAVPIAHDILEYYFARAGVITLPEEGEDS
jgi:penicillin-binding protein 2